MVEFILPRENINIKDVLKPLIKDAKLIIKSLDKDVEVEKIKVDVSTRIINSKKYKECYGIIMHGWRQYLY